MSRALSRTPLSLAMGLVGLVGVLAVATFLYDHSRRDRIAQGVSVAGIDVGGLSARAATARLQGRVAATMERPVVASVGGRSWSIAPRQSGVTVDVGATVARAVAVSRAGSILTRTWRGLTGGSVHREVGLVVRYSHALVRGFVSRIRAALDRAPRDATVEPSAGGLTTVGDRAGVAVQAGALERRVESALVSPSATRAVEIPVRAIPAAVTARELASRYPAYIVVDRSHFQLQFYSHLKLASTYPIAVGMQGLETPPGLYHIQWKQVDPPWYVPKSAWAGKLAGKVIPPGPQDPLKARFMSFDGGAGIHGIDPSEYGSIGHDASHGCVRMRIPDVIALYARTPVGTPVYIA